MISSLIWCHGAPHKCSTGCGPFPTPHPLDYRMQVASPWTEHVWTVLTYACFASMLSQE